MDFSESDDRTCSSLVHFSRSAWMVDVHKWVFSRDRASTSVYLHDGEAFFIHSVFRGCSVSPFVCSNVKRDLREDSHSFSRSLPLRHYFASFRKKTLGSFIDTSSNMSSAAIAKCSLMHNFPPQWLQLELLLCRAKEKCSRHWKRKVESLMHSIELICTSVETNEKVKCAHKSASRSQSLLVKLLEIRRIQGKWKNANIVEFRHQSCQRFNAQFSTERDYNFGNYNFVSEGKSHKLIS